MTEAATAIRFWCRRIRRSRPSPILRGKRIAVGKGSSAHGHILAQLKNAGLTPSDVQLVFLQPADALSAFTKRQADAWAIWDPYTAQAAAQFRSAVSAKHARSPTATGSASRPTRRLPTRSATLRSPICWCVSRRRPDWAKDHPNQWAQSYAAAVGLDPKVAEVSQSRSLRLPTELDDEVVASEQKIADLFAESGRSPPRHRNSTIGSTAAITTPCAPC